ncbi:hypothetical protein BJX64DRAFT_80324 [Aspergillus heterothallicus]
MQLPSTRGAFKQVTTYLSCNTSDGQLPVSLRWRGLMSSTELHKVATQSPTKRTAPTSRGSSAYARKRAVIACQVCRVRRTKCDQKKPQCSFCESIGAECISDPPALSAFDPASVAIIERLDRLETQLSDFIQAAAPTAETPKPQVPFTSQLPVAGAATKLDHVVQQPVEKILEWPGFSTECCLPSAYPQHPQSAIALHPVGPWPKAPQPLLIEDRNEEAYDKLVNQFFSYVHTRNPVLDEPNTRQLSREVLDQGIGWGLKSCLCLLVWANGAAGSPLAATARSQRDFEQSQAAALFYEAQQRLGVAFAHTGVLSAQCLFLAGVFLMTALRPFHAWRMFSQALATCRIVKRTTAYDAADLVTLECVTWSAWKSERELNRELMLFSGPVVGDMPQTFPSPPANCKHELLQSWYFYLSEISAWRLETQVTEEIRRLAINNVNGHLEDLTRTADGFTEQVSEWQKSLASEVSFTNDRENTDMLKLILRARGLYISELISWPFVYTLLHDGVRPDSPCVQRWTTRALEYHLQKLNNHRVQFYHRHHGTWLMIRSCARSVCILIAASRSPFAGPFLPSDWRAAVDDALQMLRFWQYEVVELAGVVDRLQTLYNQL